ncbi:MAG: DUF5989 family protein [Candidatus Brocadiaceae bacterium]
MMSHKSDRAEQFRKEAQTRRPGLLAEFWHFLKHNKKWWLLPILLAILLVGFLAVLGGTGVGPFIYTLF